MSVSGTNQTKHTITPTGQAKSSISTGTNQNKNNSLATYLITDEQYRIITNTGAFLCTSLTGGATNQSKS